MAGVRGRGKSMMMRSLMRPGTIPITRNARGQAELTVPRVDEYEVLVIEQ